MQMSDRYNPFLLEDEIRDGGGVKAAATLRQEYSRERKKALKRLKRFVGTEWEDSDSYRYNKNRFKPLSEINSAYDLANSLSDLRRFLDSERSTITGQKRYRNRNIQTMREHGYDWVDSSNFKDFVEFMDFLRSAHLSSLLDSERIGQMVAKAVDEGVSIAQLKEDFINFVNNKAAEDGSFESLSSMSSEQLWGGLYGENNSGGSPRKSARRHPTG